MIRQTVFIAIALFLLALCRPAPCPADLSLQSFTATVQGDHILLQWETNQEVATRGFYIQRSTNPSTGFERLKMEAVRPAGNPETGAGYKYEDTEVSQTRPTTYYYKIEEDYGGPHTKVYDNPMAGPVTYPQNTAPVDTEKNSSGGCFINSIMPAP